MSSPSGNGGRRIPAWLGPALAYAVSLGCLLWVYHDFDWRTELPKLRHIHPLWIALAVAADVLVYVSQGWRWNILLAPVRRLGLWRSVQAIYIGLFANELLPLRSGELIRCYLVSAWNHIPFPLVLSSALIERLIDGMWLIFGFAIISVFVELPQDVVAGVWILAGVVGALAALLVFAVFNQRFAHHVTTGHRWSDVLRTAVEGFHDMGRSRTFPAAVAASMVYLALQVVPIHAMLEGYGLDLPWGAAAVVLVVLRLGTVLPSAPGNVGLFHLFAYLGLHRVLGVDPQTAKSVAGVMFFIVTVPLLVAGAIALAFTGSEIRELYHRAHQRHSEHRNSVSQFRGTLR